MRCVDQSFKNFSVSCIFSLGVQHPCGPSDAGLHTAFPNTLRLQQGPLLSQSSESRCMALPNALCAAIAQASSGCLTVVTTPLPGLATRYPTRLEAVVALHVGPRWPAFLALGQVGVHWTAEVQLTPGAQPVAGPSFLSSAPATPVHSFPTSVECRRQ